RKPAPKRAETGKDQLGVSAVGNGSQPNGHLLDDGRHHKSEDDERKKKANSETSTGGGVGKHARAVVFAEHDQDSGPQQQPQQAKLRKRSASPSCSEDPIAIAGARHIFMGDRKRS